MGTQSVLLLVREEGKDLLYGAPGVTRRASVRLDQKPGYKTGGGSVADRSPEIPPEKLEGTDYDGNNLKDHCERLRPPATASERQRPPPATTHPSRHLRREQTRSCSRES